MKKIPLGIKILSFIYLLSAFVILFLIFASTKELTSLLQELDSSQNYSQITTSLIGMVGSMAVLLIIMSYGLFKGKRWAYFTSIGLALLTVIGGPISYYQGNPQENLFTYVLLNLIIVAYLLSPNARKFFKK